MEIKLIPDPEVHPEFGTYCFNFGTEDFQTVEVWVCKSSESFGIEQGEECIIFNKRELLIMQKLVNHAVKILG